MVKWLLVVLIVVVAFYLWRAARERDTERVQDTPKAKPRPLQPPQEMVRCAHCGVHLPRQDALLSGGHIYCSSEHMRLGPRELTETD